MNRNGVLEMHRRLSVLCPDGPTVTQHLHLRTSHGNHRLNGNTQTVLDLHAVSTFPIIGNLRIFVHLTTNAVTDKFADYPVTPCFTMVLYCIPDISEAFSSQSLFNTFV